MRRFAGEAIHTFKTMIIVVLFVFVPVMVALPQETMRSQEVIYNVTQQLGPPYYSYPPVQKRHIGFV